MSSKGRSCALALANEELKGYTTKLHGYNYNLLPCYPRRMVDSIRNGMLFSSSDSPKPSAILSGEGLDEGPGRIAVIVELALRVVRSK